MGVNHEIMIDEKKLNDAASSCSRVSCPIEPLRGIMLQGFLSGAAWAESHLRETGQLLDWRPYPEEKPEKDGPYIVKSDGVFITSWDYWKNGNWTVSEFAKFPTR